MATDGGKRRADFVTKLVIIGDTNVGKTCVMRRFTDDEFSYNFLATIGIDFKIRMQKVQNKLVKVQIWDTAGQEKFRSITTAYYRGAKGVLIVYDITNRKSYDHISSWITNIARWAGSDIDKMLVGNKCDLEDKREVERIEGEKLAKKHGMFFSETSAKDNINIEYSFLKLLDEIVKKHLSQRGEEDKDTETISLNKGSVSETQSNKICCRT